MKRAGIILMSIIGLSWFAFAMARAGNPVRIPVLRIPDLLNGSEPFHLPWGPVICLSLILLSFLLWPVNRKAGMAATACAAVLGILIWVSIPRDVFLVQGLKWLPAEMPLPGWTPGVVLRVLAMGMAWWMIRAGASPDPLTANRWRRFRRIRRGYVSLLILIGLTGLACMDNLLVGKQALAVRHDGQWRFPFMAADPIPGDEFGLGYQSETDYRELKRRAERENNGDIVILPPIHYSARLDTPEQSRTIVQQNGMFVRADGRLFTGLVFTTFKSKPEQRCRELKIERGQPEGRAVLYNESGEITATVEYRAGELVNGKPDGGAAELTAPAGEAPEFRQLLFPPVAPSWQSGHLLGTDSNGTDIVALLFSGYQLQMGAAVFFALFVFALGIGIGCSMGFFGGMADLAGQRLLEIWTALPFILVVMFLRSVLEPSMVMLVGVLAAFSWMGLATSLRGATYAEKARDYVNAARLIGASTPRVIFRHVVPNVISTLVTQLPFTIEALIASLTALDFLGFGLPPGEPTWGGVLKDGTDNMQSPWILVSAFSCIVIVLVLITFVGEAIREAFDPRKFSCYR